MNAPVKKKKEYFIDNKKLNSELRVYRDLCRSEKEKGLEKPRIPNYIGKSFMDIATHLAMRPNFSNYIFKEDMIMDAVENMIVCVSNYDPDRSTSALSYYTQVCWYAFLRRIAKEKRQIEIFDKIVTRSNFDTFFDGDGQGLSADYNSIVDVVAQKTRGHK